MKSKRPTIRDVAKRAEVAPITVSRVINNQGYISDETRERVEAAIVELNYIPNSLSQSLRYQKTDTIALVVSDITNPFWTTLTRGVEDVCQAHNLHVILCNTDEKDDKLANYVQMLLQRQTDGFLLVPVNQDSTHIARSIMDKHVPLVLLDRSVDDLDVTVVRGDSLEGAYLLTKYLIELGHSNIALLGGQSNISTSILRLEGYRKALKEAEIVVDESLLVGYGRYSVESGYQMAMELMQRVTRPPTAIFAVNNVIAIGILKALYESGIKVPKDISVVSFDDFPFDTTPEPFVTVVAQRPYEMGKRAAELLIAQIKGDPSPVEEIVLPVDLKIRRSSGPART